MDSNKTTWTLIIILSSCCWPCKVPFKYFWDISRGFPQVAVRQSSGLSYWTHQPCSIPTVTTKGSFRGNAKSTLGLEWGKQGAWPWEGMSPYILLALKFCLRCWRRPGYWKRSFSQGLSYVKSSGPWNRAAKGRSSNSIVDTWHYTGM